MTVPPSPPASGGVAGKLRQAVWGPTSTKIRQNQLLREPAVAAYRAAARLVLTGPPPKVLANSIPKSGTHLLTQLLGEVPKLWFSGMHFIGEQFRADLHRPGDRLGDFEAAGLARLLSRVRTGQYVTSHLPAEPGAAAELARLGFVHLLIIRDPRDVVVSRAFYLTSQTRLHPQQRFAALPTDSARLMAAIRGLPATDDERAVPSIGERLERYRPWLTDASVCLIRFEELVGPMGNGSEQAQHESIRRVLQTCDRPTDDATVRRIAGRIYARHSATFRRGTIGDWRNHLSDKHLAAFAEVAPGALAAYGYGEV